MLNEGSKLHLRGYMIQPHQFVLQFCIIKALNHWFRSKGAWPDSVQMVLNVRGRRSALQSNIWLLCSHFWIISRLIDSLHLVAVPTYDVKRIIAAKLVPLPFFFFLPFLISRGVIRVFFFFFYGDYNHQKQLSVAPGSILPGLNSCWYKL